MWECIVSSLCVLFHSGNTTTEPTSKEFRICLVKLGSSLDLNVGLSDLKNLISVTLS